MMSKLFINYTVTFKKWDKQYFNISYFLKKTLTVESMTKDSNDLHVIL
jgi:hypothetical protein